MFRDYMSRIACGKQLGTIRAYWSGYLNIPHERSKYPPPPPPPPPVNIFIVMLSGHHPYLYNIVSISTLLWIKCPLPNNHHLYCQSKWPQPTLLQYIVRVSSTPYLFIARARGPHPHFDYNSGRNPTLNLHSLLLSFYCQGKWPHLPAI